MKSRKEIILELTPLLDVILIMMFYILMQNALASQKEQQSAQDQVAEAQSSAQSQIAMAEESAAAMAESLAEAYAAMESSISDELAVAEARVEGQKSFESYAVIAEIVIVNGDGGNRNLHVICGEADNTIAYDWDSMNYAENALKTEIAGLTGRASEEKPVFIVFKYSEDEIYRRDYELVQKLLSTGASKSNIYIKYIGGKKDEK